MESLFGLPDFPLFHCILQFEVSYTLLFDLFIFVVYFHFAQCFGFDGKEMMSEMGNDMEKWNHGYNNNHVVKMKGTFVDERNRKKVSFGDALVFIVMTGQCAECKMVPSVYRSRHVLIQGLPQ